MVSTRTSKVMRVIEAKQEEDVLPVLEAYIKGQKICNVYVDGGAQICVVTHACVERLGLIISGDSRFCIHMANHQKVKCLGVVRDLEVEAYALKTVVDFHVMPAYPIILGRP